MRLPEDRILHIDTEVKNGKVNIVVEWQGELVRCKDCKHRYTFVTNETGTATHYYLCDFMDAQFDDEGYCSYGERSEE